MVLRGHYFYYRQEQNQVHHGGEKRSRDVQVVQREEARVCDGQCGDRSRGQIELQNACHHEGAGAESGQGDDGGGPIQEARSEQGEVPDASIPSSAHWNTRSMTMGAPERGSGSAAAMLLFWHCM